MQQQLTVSRFKILVPHTTFQLGTCVELLFASEKLMRVFVCVCVCHVLD